MTLSPLAAEGLYLGPSFLTADPMGPLLDHNEEALSPSSSLEGKPPALPPLSFYSPPLSPSPPPSSFLETKAGADSPSLPWLGAGDLLDASLGADDANDDAFAGMDWMSEKIDLSGFDLDSLMGSCDECPSSPEDLLASLDSHVDLDVDSFNSPVSSPHGGLDLGVPLPSLELAEVAPDQQEPPAFALDLGSEVDVQDAEKTPPHLSAAIIPDPSEVLLTSSPIVLSLPTSGHFVVVLTNQEEPPLVSIPDPPAIASPSSDCDSDSGIESVGGSPARLQSPTAGSSRTKPYSKPEPSSTKTPKGRSVSGAPKVEKKLKKMEQNKTAATRYRQKRRVEQDLLNTECEELEKRNSELSDKADSISREIQYLKDLMEEVRKRRVKSSSVA
ncbi:cyclic AMP-dependent transcription factor ATF-4 [Pungitius pungitius]|uniref:cyclic AMP-dependent transcription factor ATF-4 n=1 Tax=Pungitius pungitius TaxID=134920 RepID=UPI002E1060CF